MSDDDGINNRRLRYELDHAIKQINRDHIGEAAGTLGREDFAEVAGMVACLRARYLKTTLKMAKTSGDRCIDTDSALELKNLRTAYEEALAAFDALEHALRRGYIDFTA